MLKVKLAERMLMFKIAKQQVKLLKKMLKLKKMQTLKLHLHKHAIATINKTEAKAKIGQLKQQLMLAKQMIKLAKLAKWMLK